MTLLRQVGLGRSMKREEFDENMNEFPNKFATIAALKAATWLQVGQVVAVEEYHAGVGGGMLFGRIVAGGTGTDDGGSYIDLPTSGLQFEQNFPSVISVKMFGAKGDGVTDDTDAIQAALTQGGKVKGVFGDTYKVSSALVSSANIHLDLSGSTIDGSTIPAGTTGNEVAVLKIAGSDGANTSVTVDVTAASSSVSVASEIGFSEGDVVRLESDQTFVDGYGNAGSKRGELLIVESASSSNITFKGKTYFSYLSASNTQMTKLNTLANPIIENGTIIAGGETSVHTCVRIDKAVNPKIQNMILDKGEDSGVQLFECFGGLVDSNYISNCTSPDQASPPTAWTSGYGVVTYKGTRNTTISNNKFVNCRRAQTGGGNLPSLFVNVISNYAEGGLNAFGNHEPTFEWTISNNVASGIGGVGITVRGQKTTLNGNNIRNAGSSGCRVRSFYDNPTGINGTIIRDNVFTNVNGNGIWLEGNVTDGLIFDTTISGNSVRDANFNSIYGIGVNGLTISDCEFDDLKSGVGTDGNLIYLNGSGAGLTVSNVTINGCRFLDPVNDTLRLNTCSDVVMTGLDYLNPAQKNGVNIESCDNISISNSIIKANAIDTAFIHGIRAVDSNNLVITGNTVIANANTASSDGVHISGTSVDHVINSNNIVDFDKAIRSVAGADWSVVVGNNARTCTNVNKVEVTGANKSVANNLV